MAPDEIVSFLNTFYLAAFFIGVCLVWSRLALRWWEYHKAEWPLPLLFPRDIALFTAFMICFGLIFAARAFEWVVAGQLFWIIVTGTPPVVAVYIWAYYEFFKVERKVGGKKPKEEKTTSMLGGGSGTDVYLPSEESDS